MIENLEYSVTFPSNGVTLQGQLSFQPGVTAVTGKNGTGKTFAASEMIRYMLYGKKALRGPASDYKTLSGKMRAVIAGQPYDIVRAKKETVTDASGKVVAVGAEAVNDYLAKKMGFGLDVFDAICSANQKESERLTRLKPAERRQMIDNISGLKANEDVEKLCRSESNQLKRDADTLKDVLVKPEQPDEPGGYRPSEIVAEEIRLARAVAERRQQLELEASAAGPCPVAPALPEPTNLFELEAHEQERLRIEARVADLQLQIGRIPDVSVTEEQLDRSEAWEDYQDEVDRRGARPTTVLEDVQQQLEQWNLYNALKDQERHEATCPKCEHTFLTGLPVPDKPELSLATLRSELQAHNNWADPIEPPEGEPEFMGRDRIRALREALTKQGEKHQIQKELNEINLLTDRAAKLTQARQLRVEWDVYRQQLSDWNDRNELAVKATAELAELSPTPDVAALSEEHTTARVFESQMKTYQEALQKAEALQASINEKLKKAESYKAGAEALKRARGKFKAFLAPSLGKVASAILAQATNGRMNTVIVDDEMNISVDGQEVSTLSGAQAAVANIALRLALGRVLFSKVFPVFLGDEIDAYSDEEMVLSTATAIGELKSQLKQIILISHRRLDFADHHIEIGKSLELA